MVGRRLRQLQYGLRLGPFRETYARSGATISNQILRHQGELPSEIGEIERRAGGRGEAGQNSFRANRFCVTASASKTCMVRTAPRRKRHRGREIVLDAKEALVRRDRLYRPDQQDRRWFVAHGTLRCRPNHTDQAAQGLFTTEELGDADRQARRHEQGQGGFARRLAVIMHRMLAERAPSTLQQSDRRRATVRARHHAFSKRSAFAGTMDHVRQNYKN